MSETLVILDPTLEVECAHGERASRSGEIHILGLLDNGKPNADRLLHKVADMLREQHPGLQIRYYRKSGAYRPASRALLEEVAAHCDSVLVGIGD
jgi:hypothetical protein